MQQVRIFSPKWHRIAGALLLDKNCLKTSNTMRMIAGCFNGCRSSKNLWIPIVCEVNNKVLKMFKDEEKVLLVGVLDFDLLETSVKMSSEGK